MIIARLIHIIVYKLMLITAKLSQDIVSEIQDKIPTRNLTNQLLKLERDLDITLKPLHPGTNDKELSTYFTIDVPNSSRGNLILSHLRRYKWIEAAYVKPQDELANMANKLSG